MHNKVRGFTLVELVVVVAIIGVLAAIAFPQFIESQRRAKRADAVGVLSEAAQFMERNFSNTASYNVDANGNALVLPAAISVVPRSSTDTVYYNISLVNPQASSFTLQAAPVNSMAGDACGTFTLTNTGQRAVSGSNTLAQCWQQ